MNDESHSKRRDADPSTARGWQLAQSGTSPVARSYWVVENMLLAGAYPESAIAHDRGKRVEQLRDAGIRTFLSLMEEHEASPNGAALTPYLDSMRRLSAASDERLYAVRMPIRDVDVTTPEMLRSILDVIDLSLEANRPVYVHCLGGVGRTGTVVGCWMRRHRLATRANVLDVLARLRVADAVRGNRMSTDRQRKMVLDWKEADDDA